MPDTRTPVARTPLHHWHAAHGAHFIDVDGWQVVAAYSSAEPEAAAARAGLGLADISAGAGTGPRETADLPPGCAGFELVGPRLGEFLRRLTDLPLPIHSPAETAFAGVDARLVRPGERSLPTLRVYVAWDLGEYIWERMMEAGRDIPITAIGLEALGKL